MLGIAWLSFNIILAAAGIFYVLDYFGFLRTIPFVNTLSGKIPQSPILLIGAFILVAVGFGWVSIGSVGDTVDNEATGPDVTTKMMDQNTVDLEEQKAGGGGWKSYTSVQYYFYNLQINPYDEVIVDLDSDGYKDMVNFDSDTGEVKCYEKLNDGFESTLINVVPPASSSGTPYDLDDIDNDGNYDIAVLPYEEKYWYENNGGYDFTKHEISNTTTAPNDIEIVDLDNDKDKDIVVVNGYNPNYWYENNGQQEFIRHQIHENDNMTYACRVADMNNDGHLDIITGENGGVNYWYENNENENFTAHQIHGNINDTESLDVADFDNDGDVDVLAGNSGSMGIGSVYWYENKGDGDFIAHFVETSDERNNAEVNAKDVNNDGLVDIIIPTPLPESYTDPSYLLWYENKGDGSFISNKKDLGYNAYMVPADLNYDGMDEMYIFNNTMPT